MARRQLFEFHDLAWFPDVLRQGMIECLSRGLALGRVYDGVAIEFAAFARRCRADRALDLCSGAGGPAALLGRAAGIRMTVSDLFPNLTALRRLTGREGVDVVERPVDATDVPPDLDHPIRTIISAFHHFRPELARRILAAAVRDRRAIFIVEGFPRSLVRFAAVFLWMAPVALVNPFVADSGRLVKFLATFVVPVIPVLGLWDGVVSALRIYEPADLDALVADLGGDYVWEHGSVPFAPWGRATWFSGRPRDLDPTP